ncbi:hypothetical protein BC937DRAFT_89005 [Endogone sp. FLAS-F59071]|nr:hypothetical protein BC937DRAFT_89005 [Endogone sp. FLAS-F59071]|eukprot:RUS18241.1 hypothetical protein BC937DRAFT_89005 [Endogone sp. FLAS-F59071]
MGLPHIFHLNGTISCHWSRRQKHLPGLVWGPIEFRAKKYMYSISPQHTDVLGNCIGFVKINSFIHRVRNLGFCCIYSEYY